MDIEPLDGARMRAMVQGALEEDGARADVTVALLALGDRPAVGEIAVDAPVRVCGVEVAREVFGRVDASCTFEAAHQDGDHAGAGAVICRVSGRAASILAAERTALNFLQRMTGVATLAARYVDAVRGTGAVILDTRKTIPLWRDLDKYAVRCGGAHNHRRALDAMVLIKDNHVRALGGVDVLKQTLARVPRDRFIEVEVDSIDFLKSMLDAPVHRIMLDNFTPVQVEEAMAQVRAFQDAHGRRPEIEVSGGVTLETVRDYARAGVDFISVGAITHSAAAASMSLSLR